MKYKIILALVGIILIVGLIGAWIVFDGLIEPYDSVRDAYCEVDENCTYVNMGCNDCNCDFEIVNNEYAEYVDNVFCTTSSEDWGKCGMFCEIPLNVRCDSNKCIADW